MPNAAMKIREITADHATSGRPSGRETLEGVPKLDASGQLDIFQDSTPDMRACTQPEMAHRSAGLDLADDRRTPQHHLGPQSLGYDRLLDARQVAAKLGVSERWVRDHTTRRSPKIRAVKLGTLIRYRWADVEVFMDSLDTFRTPRHPRFGV